MFNGMRVLTLTDIGRKTRVTVNPLEVEVTEAKDADFEGLPTKEVNILFKSGNVLTVNVSDFDLLQLEQAIGMYGFAEE